MPSLERKSPEGNFLGTSGELSQSLLKRHPQARPRCALTRFAQVVCRFLSGQWLGMSVHAAPIEDASGDLVEWIGMNIDITERNEARLESLGYAVIEAKTGPEAIERLKSKEPIRLVLSYIVMPGGMTGYDVMRRAAANEPGVKVILCSGYNEGSRGDEAQAGLDGVPVLGKPYTRAELACAVSSGLAENT